MEAGKIIKTERLNRGWSQAELGKRVGVSQPAIKKIEGGATSKSKHLPKIAQELGIPLDKLDPSLTPSGNGSYAGTTSDKKPLQIIPNETLMGKNDLPVFAIVQGGRGALVLSSEPYTRVSRPHNLLGLRDAYGVLVKGSSMALEYNEGDIAYIDPHKPPREGDPCVFQCHTDDGEVHAVLKYLARSPDASDTLWFVKQTKPAKRFTLKKADWQICHVAVGKQSGR